MVAGAYPPYEVGPSVDIGRRKIGRLYAQERQQLADHNERSRLAVMGIGHSEDESRVHMTFP